MYDEWLNFGVNALTLVVLVWTLCVLKRYARDTKILATTSVEQLPRPCLVLERSAENSVEAVTAGTTGFLPDDLIFMNVGTGPAVNCRYRVRETGEWYQLPEIGASNHFISGHILKLPFENDAENDVVVRIEYESIAGARYRTEITIEETYKHKKLVRKTKFCRWPAPVR